MKSDRVLLAEWLGDITDGYTDIPWPMVHDQAGDETVRWLNQREFTDCQMILEKGQGTDSGMQKLYAEFYRAELRTEFALRFGK
jgi:hypothetical protein